MNHLRSPVSFADTTVKMEGFANHIVDNTTINPTALLPHPYILDLPWGILSICPR